MMKCGPIVFAVIIIIHIDAQAEQSEFETLKDEHTPSTVVSLSSIEKQKRSAPAPEKADSSGKSIHSNVSTHKTVSVRLYKAPNDQSMGREYSTPEVQQGLILDYFPFKNGFHVSAGTFKEEKASNASNNLYGNGRAYIGVGWKKLLDEARKIDLNIDVGTYMDVEGSEFQEGDDQNGGGSSTRPEIRNFNELPVVRLGIEFRF